MVALLDPSHADNDARRPQKNMSNTRPFYHDKRQLWPDIDPNSTQGKCPSYTLPKGSVLVFPNHTMILPADVHYTPNCTAGYGAVGAFNTSSATVNEFHAPFYASTTVLIYIVALATALAWAMLIMVLVVPSTVASSHNGRMSRWLVRHGLLSSGTTRQLRGTSSPRPWLQKFAALLVAAILTLASAETFACAQEQYEKGYLNADKMRNAVVAPRSFRIVQVSMELFIFLAQVQTLVRLFPRRKEKLIVKCLGFLLIILNLIFNCLDQFLVNSRARPRSFQDAISALNYLFSLSISLLYTAWVLYYAATKRRYAFFHRDMPNISIIAILAMCSISIPVGFFVADISVPDVSGWGDFFRWVGAAAASIIVWEWVERIEYLENEEKKDGILGREIVDEDEMQFTTTTYDRRNGDLRRRSHGDIESNIDKVHGKALQHIKLKLLNRIQKSPESDSTLEGATTLRHESIQTRIATSLQKLPQPTPTASETTPSSQATAAEINSSQENPTSTRRSSYGNQSGPRQNDNSDATGLHSNAQANQQATEGSTITKKLMEPTTSQTLWNLTFGLFTRRRRSPPPEVKAAMGLTESKDESSGPNSFWSRRISKQGGTSQQQPTVIPAPPRGQTWSPQMMRHSPVEESQANTIERVIEVPSRASHRSHGHRNDGRDNRSAPYMQDTQNSGGREERPPEVPGHEDLDSTEDAPPDCHDHTS